MSRTKVAPVFSIGGGVVEEHEARWGPKWVTYKAFRSTQKVSRFGLEGHGWFQPLNGGQWQRVWVKREDAQAELDKQREREARKKNRKRARAEGRSKPKTPGRDFKFPWEKVCPFGALGLKRKSSATEVKAAFRKAARRHHPDHNGGKGDPKAFNEAVLARDACLREIEEAA